MIAYLKTCPVWIIFLSAIIKQEFEQDSFTEENWNPKTNEQARKRKEPIKQQSESWTKNKGTINEQRKDKLEMIESVIKWQVTFVSIFMPIVFQEFHTCCKNIVWMIKKRGAIV